MPAKENSPDPAHAWLIMIKAMRALTRYAKADLQTTGLCESDFQILEILLHKGPMPVNALGPKVDLTPGSISVAVDRLYEKGLVSRVESAEDRRVRTVALTKEGKDLIVPAFRRHAATMRKAFADLTPAQLAELESSLKKVGRRAERL